MITAGGASACAPRLALICACFSAKRSSYPISLALTETAKNADKGNTKRNVGFTFYVVVWLFDNFDLARSAPKGALGM